MHYEFQPGKKKGRNRYLGSWREGGWRNISLSFTAEHLLSLLQTGLNNTVEFTHQDIAHWCDKFAMAGRMGQLSTESQLFQDIADDVSVQWDLFLANTYTLQQLQTLDFSVVHIPVEWFADWLSRAQALSRI